MVGNISLGWRKACKRKIIGVISTTRCSNRTRLLSRIQSNPIQLIAWSGHQGNVHWLSASTLPNHTMLQQSSPCLVTLPGSCYQTLKGCKTYVTKMVHWERIDGLSKKKSFFSQCEPRFFSTLSLSYCFICLTVFPISFLSSKPDTN